MSACTPAAYRPKLNLKKLLHRVISLAMVAYFISNIDRATKWLPGMLNGYGYTEYLINFEGGFVRRGLMGQGLFELVRLTGWNPYEVIDVFCGVMFVAVIAFMLVRFRALRLNWWILFTPFVFGAVGDVIRKDYLCFLITIGALWMVRRGDGGVWRMAVATLLVVLGLLMHEAYVFWGAPVVVLAMIASEKRRWMGWGCAALVVAVFLTLCVYKGDVRTADAIYNSWLPYIDSPQYIPSTDNSIGAIGWETVETIKFHLGKNFHHEKLGWAGIFMRPLFLLLAYYFMVNFMYVMHRGDGRFTRDDRTFFSALCLLTMVCLAPMFLLLSCDYGRLYQYIFVTALSTYVILPGERVRAMFPERVLRGVARFNRWLDRVVVPTAGLMVVLLFTLAPTPYYYNPIVSIYTSVLYVDIHAVFEVVAAIMRLT